MAKRMVSPRMTEVSGVDHPAHLREGWAVLKSLGIATDTSKGSSMPLTDEARAALPAEAQEYIKSLEAQAARPAPAATVGTESDDFAKSIAGLPEPVRKFLLRNAEDAAQARAVAGRLQDAADSQVWLEKARALRHLPKVTDAFGTTMQKAANGDAAAWAEVYEVLKASDGALAQSGLFEERGSDAPGSSAGATATLDGFAKALMESDPSLSFDQAVRKAAKEHPESYATHRSETANLSA